MACLPDYQANVASDQWVTIVYAKANPQIEQQVSDLGFNFIPDTREPDHKALGMAYRNMFPNNLFENSLYQGDYLPRVVTCTTDEFVNPVAREQICKVP